jgi:heat-inducible transcriptional repressor
MNTKASPELNSRAAQVLADVVESYAQGGEPVGSKMLVESGKYQLSGASIRNVMQDLEALGLLTHPHTSAGRIPTAQGYRFYTQSLVKVELPERAAQEALKAQLSPNKSLRQITQDVSAVISQLTNCAAMITAPQAAHDPLEQMEFVRLSPERVLVVMVTKAGEIENRVIEVPAFIGVEDLEKAARALKPMVVGHTLEQARMALVAALAEQKGQVNAMIDNMMAAAAQWGEPVTSDGAMVVAGSTNLFQYPELVRDKLQGLIKLFEEKRLLMALVEEVKQSPGVKIFIGNDVPLINASESMSDVASDVAVVGSRFGSLDASGKNHVVGTLGVIGPLRMDYKRTLGVVEYTAKLLDAVVHERSAQEGPKGGN